MALPAETTHQFEGKNHADLYLESRPEWPQEIIQRVMQYLLLKVGLFPCLMNDR